MTTLRYVSQLAWSSRPFKPITTFGSARFWNEALCAGTAQSHFGDESSQANSNRLHWYWTTKNKETKYYVHTKHTHTHTHIHCVPKKWRQNRNHYAPNLIRIKHPLRNFNYWLSGANVANFNKIHRTVSEQQPFRQWNSKTEVFNLENTN